MSVVIVGIDFGSSGTGYSYSYNNSDEIELGKFPDQNTEIKVPTNIILDSDLKTIKAFGEKCNNYIDGHQLMNGELYFKRIKMNLYYNIFFIKPENDSRVYPIVDVIAKIFEYIKEEVLKTIHYNKPNLREEQIKWVVTVPAIWNLVQKGIMIQACEKAGLFNQYTDRSNFLALEPEAASLYCLKDKFIDPNYIKPGKSYIICDLGGGTGDIVTHYNKKNDCIDEKYYPIGGPYGSDEIDKDFYNKVFNILFGFNSFNSLKEKFNYLRNNNTEFSWNDEDELYIEWKKLQDEIQKKKKITEDLREKSFFLNCQIFKDFMKDITLENLVDNYNKSCEKGWQIKIHNKKRWILMFPYKIIFDLIYKQAELISAQISEIIQKVSDIESILYVGGYCSNEVLIKYFKEKFKNLCHLKPSNPEKAILKGAVLFGINPNIINLRISAYTIGFNCDEDWDEIKHAGIDKKYQYYDAINGKFKCKDSFHILIKKGQEIPQDYTITESFFTMNSRIIILKFFKTLNPNPVLFTEEGVELIGNEQLDLGRDFNLEDRNFNIILKFGGTFYDAKCIHEKSGKVLKFPLYFNNSY